MAKANFKNPPLMKDGLSYEDWKSDVNIWSDVTELDEKKQGGAVFLTLEGKAQATVRAGVTRTEMTASDGLKKIITCLDSLFMEDATRSAFNSFEHFTEFRRASDMSIENFLIEFNIRYSKLKTLEMTLPEGILAYYLLKCANLSEEQQNICKATCDKLTYKDMREKIERVTSNNSSFKPKTESLFYEQYPRGDEYYQTEEYEDNQYDENYYDTTQEEHQGEQEDITFYAQAPRGGVRPPYRHPNASSLRTNVPDEYGNPTKCSFCKSIYHYREECSDYQKKMQQNSFNSRGRSRGAPRGRFQRGGYHGNNRGSYGLRPQNPSSRI